MTSDDAFELKSVMQQILAQMKDSAAGTTEYSRRTSELIAHEELGRRATAAATTATNNNTARMKSLASTMASVGQKLEKLGTSLNKTQNDFGISLASAAKLQVTAFKDSINSFVKLFTSIDFSQLFSEIGEVGSAMADMAVNAAKDFASGKGVANAFTEGGKKIGEVLTKERPGPKIQQPVLPGEIKEATKKFQEQFGVINTEFGAQIAQEAKDRGLSVDQLVDARRIFATTAMGDLNKVASIQNRFFDQFKSKGMTPKIALEAITKYAELIARNGNRFADSFARAAADAKKIGVDLSKVDQIGDSIISDFEGFLEKSAELGAMGFNLDTNTLAQLAESGDTGALFNELRSQLAATGKDITKLRRSEQLALSGAFGLSMSDIQRLAGGTPEATSMEDYAEEGNSLLGKILALLIAGGPLFSMMSSGLNRMSSLLGAGGDIVKKLIELIAVFGPAGAFAAAIVGIAAFFGYKGNKEANATVDKAKRLAAHQGGKLTDEQYRELEKEYREGHAKRTGAVTGAAGAVGGAALASRFGMPASFGAAIGGTVGTGIGYGVGYMQGGGQFDNAARAEQDKQATFDSFIKNQQVNQTRQEAGVPEASFMERLRTNFSQRVKTHMGDSLGGTYQVAPDKSNKDVIDYMKSRGMTPATPINRAAGGLVTGPGTGKSDSIPARLSNGEFVINADMVKKLGLPFLNKLNTDVIKGTTIERLLSKAPMLSTGISKAQELKAGGTEGLFSMAQSKLGGIMSSISNLFTGAGSTSSNLMGLASKIPGIGGLLGKSTGLLSGGGLKGMAGSLLGKVGLGGIGGGLLGGPMGMLGLAAPLLKKIPFVGSAMSAIAGGPGKLISSGLGKLGGLFGKKKSPVAAAINTMMPDMSRMMASLPMLSGMAGGSPQESTKNISVDTSGIEQKLDQKLSNFIAALSNIQVNMDGTKVGKLLVNVNDVAMTAGVFGAQSR